MTGARGRPRQGTDEIIVHCPSCGSRVRLAEDGLCAECRTPLTASVGELDIEVAVRARLYPRERLGAHGPARQPTIAQHLRSQPRPFARRSGRAVARRLSDAVIAELARVRNCQTPGTQR
jgi:hypothetical protein